MSDESPLGREETIAADELASVLGGLSCLVGGEAGACRVLGFVAAVFQKGLCDPSSWQAYEDAWNKTIATDPMTYDDPDLATVVGLLQGRPNA